MKSVKGIAAVAVLAGVLSVGIFVLINSHTESIAAVETDAAIEDRPDRELCMRLVRFGQVAFDRGQYGEAKHFFQKAIMVDPNHLPAWKKYNHALLALISDRIETDPGFLPELTTETENPDSSRQMSSDVAEEDDGC